MSGTTGTTDFNLADDVRKANAAWTSEDVEHSRVGTGEAAQASHAAKAREIVDAATNHNPSRAVIGLQKGIHKFLRVKPTGPRFEAIWRAMEASARANVLLAVSPYMPLARGVTTEAYGAAILMPEMNVKDLSDTPSGFLDLVASMADNDLIDIYFSDADFVKPLIAAKILKPEKQSYKQFPLIQAGKYPGEVFDMQAGGPVVASVKRFVQMGAAIEGHVWSFVIQRRYMIMQTIALVLDEFNSEIFSKSDHRVFASSQRCLACGTSGSSRKLRFCARCNLAPYCSRDCQMKHWKEHKKACKAAVQGKATAAPAADGAPAAVDAPAVTASELEQVD